MEKWDRSRYFHPLKELAEVWKVDIEKDLTCYLNELRGIDICFDGGKSITVNFAEAAVLLQNSTDVYSKKVEQLAALVYEVLHVFLENRRKAVADGPADDEADDADDSEDQFDVRLIEQVMADARQPPTKASMRFREDFWETVVSANDAGDRRTCGKYASTEIIPFEDFNTSQKNFRVVVSELTETCCLLVNQDSKFLSTAGGLMALDVSAASGDELGPTEEAPVDVLEAADCVSDGSGDAAILYEPSDGGDAPHDDTAEVDTTRDSTGSVRLNPWDNTGNVDKPLDVGQHDRKLPARALPYDLGSGVDPNDLSFLLSARCLGAEASVEGMQAGNLLGFEDLIRVERRRLLKEQLKEKRVQLEQSMIHADPADQGALPQDETPFEDIFDDVIDDDGLPVDVDLPPVDPPLVPKEEDTTPEESSKWLKECMQEGEHAQLLTESEEALHGRVAAWEGKLAPVLQQQERLEHEHPFKIEEYAEAILARFDEVGEKHSFEDVIVGEHTPWHTAIARSFLTCLTLANISNVQLQHDDSLASGTNQLFVKLLSRDKVYNFDTYIAPSELARREYLRGEPAMKRARKG